MEDWQRSNQQFTEEIGGHNFVAANRLELKNRAEDEFGAPDMIEPCIVAGMQDRARIIVEAEHLRGAENAAGEREDPGASADIK